MGQYSSTQNSSTKRTVTHTLYAAFLPICALIILPATSGSVFAFVVSQIQTFSSVCFAVTAILVAFVRLMMTTAASMVFVFVFLGTSTISAADI